MSRFLDPNEMPEMSNAWNELHSSARVVTRLPHDDAAGAVRSVRRPQHSITRGLHARTLAPVVLLGLATLSFAAGCSRQETAATTTDEHALVLGAQDVATARRTRLTSGVALTGSLQPAWQVIVKAQIPGTLRQLKADRGTRVTEGQLLATIEAQGIRGAAEGARAAVAAAEANVAVAQQRLESARTLRAAGAMSDIDLKTAQATYEAALAQLAAARAQASGAGEQEARASVRAPLTGVVASRTAQEGEAVSPGDELFTVVRSDVLELSGEVPVDAAAQIRPGQAVVFTLPAQPAVEYKGEVARIEPMANPATRQVGVYLRMRNPGGVIGGQFATGRVLGTTSQEVVVIPETAVRRNGDSAFVLVVKDGAVARRTVTPGALDVTTGLIAVVSGLADGEQVITTPSASIADGTRVQLSIPAEGSGMKAREN